MRRQRSRSPLHLLSSPSGIGLAHVGGRLDRGNELEHDVAHADEADDRARDDAQHAVVQQDRSDEDVEGTTANEGEEKRGVARDLRWDLKLEEAGRWRTGRASASRADIWE